MLVKRSDHPQGTQHTRSLERVFPRASSRPASVTSAAVRLSTLSQIFIRWARRNSRRRNRCGIKRRLDRERKHSVDIISAWANDRWEEIILQKAARDISSGAPVGTIVITEKFDDFDSVRIREIAGVGGRRSSLISARMDVPSSSVKKLVFQQT
jgi:hypothetical protein